MSDLQKIQTASEMVARAQFLFASEQRSVAIELLREATAIYASVAQCLIDLDDELIFKHAFACRLCGDYLFICEQFAEAAHIYQVAVDQFQRLDTEEAEASARRSAARVLECIECLTARHGDRLSLLISQYEHRRRQFAVVGNCEADEAACVKHIARIYQRRERYEESILRYLEAIDILERAGDAAYIMLEIAECHHRVANMQSVRLNDVQAAIDHYRVAISLYARYEEPAYGVQQARDICERALNELEGGSA